MARTYEILLIVRPDYDNEQVASVIARYKDVITEHQGTVSIAEQWAKRRLAYEIEGVREGIYIIIIFEGAASLADELDRRMKIDQEIFRHMISRIDHISSSERERKPSRQKTRTQPERIVRDTKAGSANQEPAVVQDDVTKPKTSEN